MGLGLIIGQGPGNALAVFLKILSYKCSEHFCLASSVVRDGLHVVSCHVVSHFRSSDRVKDMSPKAKPVPYTTQ